MIKHVIPVQSCPNPPKLKCSNEMCRSLATIFFQHLKRETAKALHSMASVREQLDRAEAAVQGGKQERNLAVADLEKKLGQCQQELCRLQCEVRFVS